MNDSSEQAAYRINIDLSGGKAKEQENEIQMIAERQNLASQKCDKPVVGGFAGVLMQKMNKLVLGILFQCVLQVKEIEKNAEMKR